MKKFKMNSLPFKILSCILCLYLVISATTGIGASGINAAENSAFTCAIGTTENVAGAEVTVPVTFQNVPSSGISAAYFKIKYDPTVLTAESITADNGIVKNPTTDFAPMSSIDSTNGVITVGYSDMSQDGSGVIKTNGTFANIKFLINASAPVKSYDVVKLDDPNEGFSDNNLNSITPEYTNGKVNVALSDASAVAADKTALDLGDITAVTSDISLPVTGVNGSTITWASNKTLVISNAGKVTRPAIGSTDTNVTLTATIKKGTVSDTKMFTATVKALQLTDADAVAADKAALNLGNLTAVISDINLPATGTNGSTITWESSNAAVLTDAGKVTRPAVGEADITATLTATIKKGTVSDTKVFNVTVTAKQPTDADIVAADKAALTLGTVDLTSVTNNITLPTTGARGSGITWRSDNPNVLSNTGVVKRPTSGQKDVQLKLTATITKGTATDIKVFDITVKALDPIPATSIKLNKDILNIQIGKTSNITATLQPGNTTDVVTWESSNNDVATVDANGLVTGKKEGNVTITAKANDKVLATCKVNVIIDECFIATAAYGSKFEPSVVMLRHFRDNYLLTNTLGSAFVKFYYKNSPPIANFIAHNNALKFVTRILLTPFIAVVYGVFHPVVGVIELAAIGVLTAIMIRRRRKLNKALN